MNVAFLQHTASRLRHFPIALLAVIVHAFLRFRIIGVRRRFLVFRIIFAHSLLSRSVHPFIGSVVCIRRIICQRCSPPFRCSLLFPRHAVRVSGQDPLHGLRDLSFRPFVELVGLFAHGPPQGRFHSSDLSGHLVHVYQLIRRMGDRSGEQLRCRFHQLLIQTVYRDASLLYDPQCAKGALAELVVVCNVRLILLRDRHRRCSQLIPDVFVLLIVFVVDNQALGKSVGRSLLQFFGVQVSGQLVLFHDFPHQSGLQLLHSLSGQRHDLADTSGQIPLRLLSRPVFGGNRETKLFQFRLFSDFSRRIIMLNVIDYPVRAYSALIRQVASSSSVSIRKINKELFFCDSVRVHEFSNYRILFLGWFYSGRYIYSRTFRHHPDISISQETIKCFYALCSLIDLSYFSMVSISVITFPSGEVQHFSIWQQVSRFVEIVRCFERFQRFFPEVFLCVHSCLFNFPVFFFFSFPFPSLVSRNTQFFLLFSNHSLFFFDFFQAQVLLQLPYLLHLFAALFLNFLDSTQLFCCGCAVSSLRQQSPHFFEQIRVFCHGLQ